MKKPKTAYYLRASGNSDNFQQRLASALRNPEGERMWRPNDESDLRRVVCDFYSNDGFTCGTLVQIERGRHQHLFVQPDKETHKARLESAEVAKSKEGLPRDVVEGALWFVCKGRHFAVAPSQTLRAPTLREHLDWLLREQYQTIRDPLDLDPDPGVSAAAALDRSKVKSVTLGNDAPLSAPRSGEKTTTNILSLDKGIVKMLASSVGGAFSSILGNEDLDALGIDLKLIISIRQRPSSHAEPLVRLLGKQMILNEVEDVTVDFYDGSKVKGTDLIQSSKIYAQVHDGIPSTQSVYSELSRWLNELIQSQKVRP
jgi:hypothetical protein